MVRDGRTASQYSVDERCSLPERELGLHVNHFVERDKMEIQVIGLVKWNHTCNIYQDAISIQSIIDEFRGIRA